MLPWKRNCFLYWNDMWFWLILSMKGKVCIIWLVLMCYLSNIWLREKQHSHHLALRCPVKKKKTKKKKKKKNEKKTRIYPITKTYKNTYLGSAVAQWWAYWPLEVEVQVYIIGLGKGIFDFRTRFPSYHLQAWHENSLLPSGRDINWRSSVQEKSHPVQVKEPYSNFNWLLVSLRTATGSVHHLCPPRRFRCKERKKEGKKVFYAIAHKSVLIVLDFP